jgi:xylem cysteine proteinase
MNSLADLTHEEYKNHYLGYKPALRQANAPRPATFKYANVSDEGLPMAMDWRVQKAVTAVKNQEQVRVAPCSTTVCCVLQ